MNAMIETTLSTDQEIKVPKTRRLPGEEGIWVFVLGDMCIFGVFFLVFGYHFTLNPEMYIESQLHLNKHYGAINTLLLLSGSWFVVMGLHAVRRNLPQMAGRFILLAIACGSGFAVVKFLEYGERFAAGITLLTNEFFMFYFIYTAIHFLHLIIGMGVLFYLWGQTRVLAFKQSDESKFESGAVYWHMVDLLWIVLFPLLYMIR